MPRKYGTTVYVRSKWPLMLRIKGTVILTIWWQVLLVGVFSALVLVIHNYTGWKMNYSLSLVSIMGMVVSLLLVFRTNTAYDRYWEGRRLWSQMTLSIRNLTRGIWVCVVETETRDVLEKKSAINLLVAFAYATKHYLREEYGYDYEDMVDLLAHIPKYSLPTSTQPMDWRTDIPTALETLQQQAPTRSHLSEKSGGQPQQAAGASSNVSQSGGTRARHRQNKSQALAFDFLTPTNIPVELTYYIGSYIKACSNKQKVDPATLTMMNNALVMMVDCLTGFERILRTPIPLAYSIHLHHATWIYLLSLPFQLVSSLNALMIPAVMLSAFTLLGILGIGYEIENPFNDDYNDLPLDDFCKVIQAEVESMVATRSPVPSDWIFSDSNFPLSNSRLSAKELSALSLEKVHELMAQEHEGRPSNVQYSRAVPGNNNGGVAFLEPNSPTSPTRSQSGSGVPSVVIDVPAPSVSGLTKVNSNKATV